jgi:hypothetical protein
MIAPVCNGVPYYADRIEALAVHRSSINTRNAGGTWLDFP